MISLAKINKAKKCLDHTNLLINIRIFVIFTWVRYPFVSIGSSINGPHTLHNTTGTTWIAKGLKKIFLLPKNLCLEIILHLIKIKVTFIYSEILNLWESESATMIVNNIKQGWKLLTLLKRLALQTMIFYSIW